MRLPGKNWLVIPVCLLLVAGIAPILLLVVAACFIHDMAISDDESGWMFD